MEAANSAENTSWVLRTLVSGKNETAIAAAVSRPGFPLEITVIYLDLDNVVRDLIYTVEGNWQSGHLSDQEYTAMPNSSLAAMYNQCELCANTTIIAFQDANGYVQIGNYTQSGWVKTQLGAALNPYLGTGLALHPHYRNGTADQINLFFQSLGSNLSLAAWKPSAVNGGSKESNRFDDRRISR